MGTRLILWSVLWVLAAGVAGGAWWATHRTADPVERAAVLESRGELRPVLFERRAAVSKDPNDAGARVVLAQTWLHLYDGLAAEKEFRAALGMGGDRRAALQGLGEALSLQGRWQDVLKEIPDTGDTAAATASLLLLRGTAQMALGQIDAATATRDTAERAMPAGVAPLMLTARLALIARNMKLAESAVDSALQLEPARLDALLLKLRTLSGRDAPGQALTVADRAVAAAPWSVEARLTRADLLLTTGQTEKARQEVDWVRPRYPSVPGARYLHAVLLAREGRTADAAVALEGLGPIADLFPRALYIHALVAATLGQQATASALAGRYNAKVPTDRDGIVLLARLQLREGRAGSAVPLLEKAVADAPSGTADPALLALLGAAYSGIGSESDAFRVRQDAAALAPGNAAVLTGLGASQLRRGDVSAGIETLERSAQLAPPSPAASDALFGAAVRAGDLNQAETALARRRTQEGDTEAVGVMTALLMVARGDVEGGREALVALVAKFPAATVPRINLGKLLLAQGKRAEADSLLLGVLAKEPANLPALATILPVLQQEKAVQPALRLVDAAQAAAPADLRFTAMRAELLLGAGDPTGALSALEARRVSGRLPAQLLRSYAQAQAALGDVNAALASYRALLEMAPADLDTRLTAMRLLLSNNRPDEARVLLRDGLARLPGTPVLLGAVVGLEAQSGLDAGLKAAAALRAEPRNLPAAALLEGDLLMQAKQFARAAAAFRTEFTATPTKQLAMRLSQALVLAGQGDAGGQVLRDWGRAHPDDPEVTGLLARLDTLAGRWDEAQAELEARLRRRPNDAEAANNLAWIYHTKGDPRALPLARRAYELVPAPLVADTLGWIMLAHGDVSAATALLEQAVARAPGNPSLTYHLAAALQKGGRSADGVKLLEPLLAQPAAFEERPAAEALLRTMKGGG